jgi:hypothetical protein
VSVKVSVSVFSDSDRIETDTYSSKMHSLSNHSRSVPPHPRSQSIKPDSSTHHPSCAVVVHYAHRNRLKPAFNQR